MWRLENNFIIEFALSLYLYMFSVNWMARVFPCWTLLLAFLTFFLRQVLTVALAGVKHSMTRLALFERDLLASAARVLGLKTWSTIFGFLCLLLFESKLNIWKQHLKISKTHGSFCPPLCLNARKAGFWIVAEVITWKWSNNLVYVVWDVNFILFLVGFLFLLSFFEPGSHCITLAVLRLIDIHLPQPSKC